ncbi:MAG: bifunctional phosphopantothenoylcysteine decarboxylase/phosphopantothenate--cysteine ligase CoaBC [Burkholderiales bacterium]|nr:bifunctional phosphopantothenoylcysteine decarboxylase/phosphopantothenate--cysteine ligase CoaBC [Burkholderiales bacterium]GIK86403.1 MAG: phosphopantothenoylcysteine decarboxylase [Betaproteobacteria bacterium]
MSTLPTPPRPARVVVGVTGGIAAYKTAELVRLLVKDGVTVDVVMTQAGTRFVTPTTFQALSGRAVLTDLWASGTDNAMGHIGLSRGADAILVAPASADFLAKLANGHADDLLSTLCLARECALLVAPAMNVQMWNHAATQRNVARLREDGVTILGPGSGDLACNEVGDGRMLEPEDLRAALTALRSPKLLAGRRVLVTAGPTFEAIDPVRGITNTSSGKMGFAFAQAAAEAGARVTLVAGPTPLRTPPAVARVDVRSAADMAQAVLDRVDDADVFVAIAAVADYTPAAPSERKLKKSGEALTITLQPTVDILATVAARPSPPYCVGFAAESHDVLENAETKRKRKKLPLLVANRAQDALGSDDNEVTLLDDAGAHPLPRMDKRSLGRRLVEEIGIRLPRAP